MILLTFYYQWLAGRDFTKFCLQDYPKMISFQAHRGSDLNTPPYFSPSNQLQTNFCLFFGQFSEAVNAP